MRKTFEISLVLLALAVAFSTTVQAQSNTKEIKGKPLRGEPIRRPAKAPEPAPKPEPKTATQISGDYQVLGFDKLANFTFEVPEGVIATGDTGKSNEQIPAEVRAFNKKRVALTGFMLPLKVDNGLVSEMLIMKDQSMCCYGSQPRINDWVSVKMGGKGVKSVMDQPVTVFGEIRVGEMLENGYLIGIYEMTGEKMELSAQ